MLPCIFQLILRLKQTIVDVPNPVHQRTLRLLLLRVGRKDSCAYLVVMPIALAGAQFHMSC